MITDITGTRTLRSQWEETVRCYGDCTFLEYVNRADEVTRFTYNEFDHHVTRIANALLKLGVEKGELVALHMHNSPEYLMCWLALAKIAAVSVPLNEHFRRPESEYVIGKCGIRRVIAEPESVDLYAGPDAIEGLDNVLLSRGTCPYENVLDLKALSSNEPLELTERRPVEPQDIAVLLFTSGTTKHPKGAIYTHTSVIYGGMIHVVQIGMGHDDRFLSSMPCYHMDFQEMACTPTIITGGTLIMIEHYSARRFWRQVVEMKASFTDTMSIMNRTMMLQPVQPWEKDHCLKQIYFSMGMSDEEKERFEERFNVSLLNCYGMTETVSGVTCAPLFGEKRWPSVGVTQLSYQIKIIDDEGNELEPNQPGEICVQGTPGRSLVLGYYNDPESTAKLLPGDGWMHTGDLGWLDEAGYLYFIGRRGEMIKRAGENISALEVECVLTSHPEVVDAAVISVPDPIRDQAVKAVVQLDADSKLTADELQDYCSHRLSSFKVPTEWAFVNEFPRTATGKIQKQKLH